MKVIFCVYFFIYFFEEAIQKRNENACFTPKNETGECINIKSCPTLFNLLNNRLNNTSIILLRNSTCGYENRDPKVCCPVIIQPPKNSSVPDIHGNNIGSMTTLKPNNLIPQHSTSNSMLLFPNATLQTICGRTEIRTHNRIVGGVPASLGDWPWIVALGYRDFDKPTSSPPKWMCGGSLISHKYVVTAAHCTVNIGERELSVVRLGDLNLDPEVNDGADPINVPIDDIIHHELYNSKYFIYDIALLKLNNSVEFNKFIQPICLPIDPKIRVMNFIKTVPFVAGWGATEFRGPSSNALLETQIPVVENASCKTAYKNKTAIIDDRVLCAGYKTEPKNACQGDSGGPLMWSIENQYYLIGVTSFGYKCVEPGFPGVFTRVTYYVDWIIGKMK
ncbi:venom protease-like isoform X2 [Daktulosphaira vitifoliae]|uniref:venom protease-like isoform X2 n=1 Tax=Daktulosphaira vitifoliae TaxID=58002 RepID=UPI0021A9A7DC|nr:venom protease-like isoform X2 [Daktulosphaira vitifoliae]